MSALAWRTFALACWCYPVWILLAWTRTAEQLLFGAGISLLVGCALAPLGPVPGPWRLLVPRNAAAALRLLLTAAARIPVANLRLAARIWRPSRPLRSGMVVVPTRERTDLGLTTVGLVSSLIVDNQIVDLDRRWHLLQYHAVDVPDGSPEQKRAAINAPIERCLEGLPRRTEDR
jgi:multicomponent Na+:H+ antiporter subunit E